MSRYVDEPREGTYEAEVLSALRALTANYGPGWNRSEDDLLVPTLDVSQTMGALERLSRKDLVHSEKRHPGQGNAYLEFVWFSTGV